MSLADVVHGRRGIDHSDERRDLMVAFNGDLDSFVARQVRVVSEGNLFHASTGPTRMLLYVIKGNGGVNVDTGSPGANFTGYTMERGTRLLLPQNKIYQVDMSDDVIMLLCEESPFPLGGNTIRSDQQIVDSLIYSNEFEARQIKVAVMHKDSMLGGVEGHWHNYGELFYLQRGTGVFELQDIDAGQYSRHPIEMGQRIHIPRRIAHKVQLSQDAILIGCTEQPYVSEAENDHQFRIEPNH